MKRPQPDIGQLAATAFIATVGRNRKFIRLWGTQWAGGVEVLRPRQYYYPDNLLSPNHEKLFRFLGVYNDVKGTNGEGIEKAWFTVNKDNGPESFEVKDSYIADNLNRVWWNDADGPMPEGLTLTTSIVIGNGFGFVKSSPDIDMGASKADQAQQIIENYDDLWDKQNITQEGVGVIHKGSSYDAGTDTYAPDEDDLTPDDPWLAILARYALKSEGVPCTIKNVEVGIGKNSLGMYNTAVVTLEIPYKEFTVTDNIVQKISDDLGPDKYVNNSGSGYLRYLVANVYRSNEHITQATVRKDTFIDPEYDKEQSIVSRRYIPWDEASTEESSYASLWHKWEGTWCLKAEVFRDPKKYGLTHLKLHNYVFPALDTGYKKKKVPFWKKIVAVIVFIIAVIVTVISNGTASPWMQAAYAVLAGSFALAVGAFLFSAMGMTEMAMAFSSVNKAIEPLVRIAQIIVLVDMVSGFQEAFKEGASAGLQGVATTIIDNITQGIKDLVKGQITQGSISVVNNVLKAYTSSRKNKLEEINSKNKDIKAEYEQLAQEMAQEDETMRGFMSIYARPATADWSMYASLFDLPYERGGGSLAIGNIQRTTKQAIRKADYDDPAFEQIMLM